jgi:hypothetical protein
VFADPAVRINELTASLGARGTFESICADQLAPPLQRVARAIVRPLATACIAYPPAPGYCRVVDRWIDAEGNPQAAELTLCGPDLTAPCWDLVNDPACQFGSQRLHVTRDADSPSPDVMTAIDCGVSPGVP